ncbi:MAG: hypothetical protein LBR34_04455 [Prevotella sp.]|jgi:hypothetical protein|nr:hypothetical protein [Prevotella sp.]
MKKLVLLFLALPFVFAACNSVLEDENVSSGNPVTSSALVGQWTYKSVSIKSLKTDNNLQTELIKAFVVPLLPELINLESYDLPDYAEFKADNTVILSGIETGGTYSLNEAGNTLTIVTGSGTTNTLTVSMSDEGYLTIEQDVTGIVQEAIAENFGGINVLEAIAYIHFEKTAASE